MPWAKRTRCFECLFQIALRNSLAYTGPVTDDQPVSAQILRIGDETALRWEFSPLQSEEEMVGVMTHDLSVVRNRWKVPHPDKPEMTIKMGTDKRGWPWVTGIWKGVTLQEARVIVDVVKRE